VNSKRIYSLIRQTVDSYIPGSRIILFGSHAKNLADDHSDYDLLIITPHELDHQKKISWQSRLDKAIVQHTGLPIDLLLSSEKEVQHKQFLPGHIIQTALKEGIQL
jgi:uncharacterized protein